MIKLSCLAAISLVWAKHTLLECTRHARDDVDALACVTSHKEDLNNKDAVLQTIDLLMSRGLFETAEKLIDAGQQHGVSQADISTTVFQSSSKAQRRLQGLQDRASKHANAAGIPPAFEWAQSPDSIFLNVKFAHKLDTPATLGCEADPPVFRESEVTFRAECRDKRKTFLLSMVTYKPLAEENCTWSMSSVGRASLTLRKAVNGTWPRLLASAEKRPGNMHIWWAMKEAHEEANKAFEKAQREAAKATPTPSPPPGEAGDANGTAPTDSAHSPSSAEASPAPVATPVAEVPASPPSPIPTPSPDPTPTPAPTPEDPVAVVERAKAKELADASTGEASELKSLDVEASGKRRVLEERYKGERAGVEREISEGRKQALAKWEQIRKEVQDRYASALEIARQQKAEQDAEL